jgi:ubiquinone/menaquinone biosynthesis C-methylase UbiE
MSRDPAYSLALTDEEVRRYRFMAHLARRREAKQWRTAGFVPDARVADIGCGPGLVLVELADVVGSDGYVVGIDRGAAEIAMASTLISERGLTNATAHVADAWATGIEDGSIDVVNVRHVLAHNTTDNQQRILAHALDLLRPGGTLYAVDADLTMSRNDPCDDDARDLNDAYVAHLIDTGRDPSVGPKLGSLAASAGFGEVQRFAAFTLLPPVTLAEIRPPAWAARQAMIDSGHATADDVARWDRALTASADTAVARNRAAFIASFMIVARKPE